MATTEAAIQTKSSNSGTELERIEEDLRYYRPFVDIRETPEAFVFEADLPGVKPEAVEIDCDDGEISIRGKVRPRQPETQQYVDREYGVGNFYRAFTIDAPIKAEAIKAELKNGVLTLTVPKSDSAKTRKIPVVAP